MNHEVEADAGTTEAATNDTALNVIVEAIEALGEANNEALDVEEEDDDHDTPALNVIVEAIEALGEANNEALDVEEEDDDDHDEDEDDHFETNDDYNNDNDNNMIDNEAMRISDKEKARLWEQDEEKRKKKKIGRKSYYQNVEKPKRQQERKIKSRLVRRTFRYDHRRHKGDTKSAVEHFVKDVRGMGVLTFKRIVKWKEFFDKYVKLQRVLRFETVPSEPLKIGNEINDGGPVFNIVLWREDDRFARGGEFVDLFEIKKSTLENAKMGLFAKRSFQPGDVMGLFYGKVFREGKKTTTEYGMESKSCKVIIDAQGGIDSKHPFYFGLHFANDPTIAEKSMKKLTRSASKQLHNFFIDEDFIARASRDIYVGDELFLYYAWGEEPDECTCSGCIYRMQEYEERPES
jgi:hypothetical protein